MKDYDLVAALEHIDIANDCGTDLVLDNEEVVALKKHLASIRAEALKDAADRAVECFMKDIIKRKHGISSGDDYAILNMCEKMRAAILAREVEK